MGGGTPVLHPTPNPTPTPTLPPTPYKINNENNPNSVLNSDIYTGTVTQAGSRESEHQWTTIPTTAATSESDHRQYNLQSPSDKFNQCNT
jgi:hypothetical protein